MFRIIIADDHPVVMQAVKQLMQEEFPSIYVEEATDTSSLLEKVLNHPWDLVITDLAMPQEGGFSALKKIKQAKKNLPVLVISTYPAELYQARILKEGAEGFISKDSLPGGLVNAVRKIIKKKK